jgi:hypothetical protein
MNKKTIVMALLAPLALPAFAGRAHAGTPQMTAQVGASAQVKVQYGSPVQQQYYPYQPPVQQQYPYQPPVQQHYPYQPPVQQQYPYWPNVQSAPPAQRPYVTYSPQSQTRGGYVRRIPRPSLRAYTELRLAQFRGGRLFVYDGAQLVGSFDQAANLRVIEGRAYGIVVTRGGRVMWQGQVLATPGQVLVHLDRNGRPNLERRPPPPVQSPQYVDYAYRPLDHGAFRGACHEVDTLQGDQHRLGWMRQTFHDRPVSVSQVGELLGRLSFESSRLAALEALAPNLVGDGDDRWLLGHFVSFEARARASVVLGLR